MDIESTLHQDIQQSLYRALDLFDRLATDYQINYNACGGTLLGQLRNQELIPWDDDIDLAVNARDWGNVETLFYSLPEMETLPFTPSNIHPNWAVRPLNFYNEQALIAQCITKKTDIFYQITHPRSIGLTTTKYKIICKIDVDTPVELHGVDLLLHHRDKFCPYHEKYVRSPFGSLSIPRPLTPVAEAQMERQYGASWRRIPYSRHKETKEWLEASAPANPGYWHMDQD